MTGLSPLDFHHGEALLRVAGHYPTLLEVIFETVQNAIDAEAENISIEIVENSRAVVVSDDGIGVTQKKFEKALTSVCCSIKDGDKIGQFGMGLIAPLSICERFSFTSTPKSNSKLYLRWTFVTEDIRKQSRVHGIPMISVPDLFFERKHKGKKKRASGVPWRSQVKIEGYTKDRILSKISVPLIREGILQRFSAAMRRRGTVVNVLIRHKVGEDEADRIVPRKYQGTPLPVERVLEKPLNRLKASFELYIASKGIRGRRGNVLVGEGHNDFRLSFAQFVRNSGGDILSADIVTALNSGVFEGEILSDFIKLDPGRKYFLVNDDFLEFCIQIGEWWQKIGENEYLRVLEDVHEQRYQALGLRSMNVIKALLDRPEFSHLHEVVKSFQVGTIGVRHKKPKKGKIIGLQEQPSIAVSKGEPTGEESGRGTSEPTEERPPHTPFSVMGPKGRQRTLVRHNSLGLQFLYEEFEGDDSKHRVWIFDSVCGILRFNVKHPLWVECDDKNETTLMRFQEHIALSALQMETVPDDWRDRYRQLFDDTLDSFVFWLCNADQLSGRKKKSRSGAKAKVAKAKPKNAAASS